MHLIINYTNVLYIRIHCTILCNVLLQYVHFCPHAGAPSTPTLTYKSTLNEMLVSWSPVDSDTVCGPVTYNITVMPSHGMMMMINDTAYNITGLNNDTYYNITVYSNNKNGDGEPTTVFVKTKLLPPGNYSYIYV